MNLILFNTDEIDNSGRIKLTERDPRTVHMKKILKADIGFSFEAGIINGKQGRATVSAIKDGELTLNFIPESDPVGLHPITLLLGLSRPPTVKKVLKEATALGVSRFILFGTENGEKSYKNSNALKPDKILDVLIEGVQQAVCTQIPEVSIEHSLRCAIEALAAPQGTLMQALDNYEAVMSLSEYWRNAAPGAPHTILAVGSERGWTDRERVRLRNSGFTLCSLGPRVLRTETASIAGTALCLSGMGII
ncbi:MAG: RsmE family RNA methyltransferase [Spirochaetales bacterium]|uniref:Ribosomal RNA small subunit methyltransferase E n=1 Tax=Candidatus Thalassospirochaeta sargassi TaxID=3119039 RepID=A0AAJ1IBP7_9SPIO|nr:RsmE family RNA methyltransferase [Spirochaetales bacterium]